MASANRPTPFPPSNSSSSRTDTSFLRKPFDDDPRSRLFLALDVPSWDKAEEYLVQLAGSVRRVKVGLELFFAEGSRVVETLAERGYEVFLDLKLHDIPNTIYRSVRVLPAKAFLFLTVHASGGREMIHAAHEGLVESLVQMDKGSQTDANVALPYLLGVTWLTSLSEVEIARLGVERESSTHVLAENALAAGAAGLVASAWEVAHLRTTLGPGPILVVPGIRPLKAGFDRQEDDQRRVSTPSEAIRAGADAVVVGRPILCATNPREAAENILREIAAALFTPPNG